MKNMQSAMTVAVLANAAELASLVAEKLDQEATQSNIAGNELTRHTVHQTAQVVFHKEINSRLGAQ